MGDIITIYMCIYIYMYIGATKPCVRLNRLATCFLLVLLTMSLFAEVAVLSEHDNILKISNIFGIFCNKYYILYVLYDLHILRST